MLVRSSFPLDDLTKKGKTAMAIAAEKGHVDVIELLYHAGADINKVNKDGIGPLYLSIINEH